MLAVLDMIVADDPETRGDLWRSQPWVTIPKASEIRPPSYPALSTTASLKGKRIGIPAMYINADPLAGTAENPGIGGPTGQRIVTRPSILALWEQARQAMEAAGATVIVTDFPVITNYEGDRPGAPTIRTRGLVSPAYLRHEIVDLSVWSWDDFLAANGDPRLNRLAQVDGRLIFPLPKGALPDRYDGFDDDIGTYPANAAAHPVTDFRAIPHLAEGFQALEETRRRDLEGWMDGLGLDAVVFPAAADIGPADADTNPASFDKAWANGVWVANGNLAIRHLGIPTVTVPMGVMADTGMPAGLTFAGRGWDDTALLQLACAFEATGDYRKAPPRVPRETLVQARPLPQEVTPAPVLELTVVESEDMQHLSIRWQTDAALIRLTVNGAEVQKTSLTLPKNTHIHSEWLPPYGPVVVAEFADGTAAFAAL
jgi:amidase